MYGTSWLYENAQKQRLLWAKQTPKDRFKDWSLDMKWDTWVPVKGKTYCAPVLFPEVTPKTLSDKDLLTFEQDGLKSLSGEFLYRNNLLPAYHPLGIYKKRGEHKDCSRGHIFFDEDVITPALYQRRNGPSSGYDQNPWMSFTPNEFMTLRSGIRAAKGHTIVAGLGLGWQLSEISKRSQVKKLTLVEISEELVIWLMPVLKKHLHKEVEVVIGDARQLLPKMEADVCVIDIFDGYGFNSYDVRDYLASKCARIKKWWVWG